MTTETTKPPTGRRHHREVRWSARKKTDLVLRLLRGESLDALCRETGLPASRIAEWRDAFLAAGETSLKSRRGTSEASLEAEKHALQRKLGEVTMEAELLRLKCDELEKKHPFVSRRSKR